MKQEKWLTPPKVAARLTEQGYSVSAVSIRNWIPTVVPASERIRTPGGHWRIDPESISRFLTHFDSSRAAKVAKN